MLLNMAHADHRNGRSYVLTSERSIMLCNTYCMYVICMYLYALRCTYMISQKHALCLTGDMLTLLITRASASSRTSIGSSSNDHGEASTVTAATLADDGLKVRA
jgi:hypothetical protein